MKTLMTVAMGAVLAWLVIGFVGGSVSSVVTSIAQAIAEQR